MGVAGCEFRGDVFRGPLRAVQRALPPAHDVGDLRNEALLDPEYVISVVGAHGGQRDDVGNGFRRYVGPQRERHVALWNLESQAQVSMGAAVNAIGSAPRGKDPPGQRKRSERSEQNGGKHRAARHPQSSALPAWACECCRPLACAFSASAETQVSKRRCASRWGICSPPSPLRYGECHALAVPHANCRVQHRLSEQRPLTKDDKCFPPFHTLFLLNIGARVRLAGISCTRTWDGLGWRVAARGAGGGRHHEFCCAFRGRAGPLRG